MYVHLVRFRSNCRVQVNVNKHSLAKTVVDFATAVRTSPSRRALKFAKTNSVCLMKGYRDKRDAGRTSRCLAHPLPIFRHNGLFS